ncbi:EF-P lysine aminoacylase GenX [Patescibacteria group bacterium]|nr:MAG: EF-P lysine aminoacylase GenX [Patescibacteria group bacterium]
MVLSPEKPLPFSIVEITGLVAEQEDGSLLLSASAGRELSPPLREPKGEKQWERLLAAPASREIFRSRAAVIAEIRKFFAKRGFLEVETPALVATPGMEPYLTPFETELIDPGGRRRRAHLATSPEYALKKLLAAGFERVFELARVFRNREALGGLHNPEFLMLEWYRAYASYLEIMEDAEDLVRHLAKTVCGRQSFRVRGTTVNLGASWERLSVAEAFQKYAAIDLEKNLAAAELRKTLRAKGYRPAESERYEDLFFRVFLNEIEPCLGRKSPTILYDYPAELSALARRSERDPRFAERFEIYIGGVELGNAFGELTDPAEQERRLLAEYALRKKTGQRLFGPDQDFLDALRTGLPPSGGIALGVDRLVMILLEKERLEDVRLFPAGEMFKKTTT